MFGIVKKTQSEASPAEQPASTLESAQNPSCKDIWQHLSTGRSVNDEVLCARLAETVAWCDSLMSLADLRSKTLRPSLFHDGPDYLVRDLGQSRQFQLRYRKMHVRYEPPVVATGRLMLYFPDENLADGYAEAVSGGFFDADNVPAYDTWVSILTDENHPRQSARRYLLCYVPAYLIDVADAGIEGNPEECIVWLDQSDCSIRRRGGALLSHAPLQRHTP